jgi:hypothetical protein
MSNDDFWVDDLYDMDEGQLRAEAEKYVHLARKYPHPTTQNQPGYKFAYLRHSEAMKILSARSK